MTHLPTIRAFPRRAVLVTAAPRRLLRRVVRRVGVRAQCAGTSNVGGRRGACATSTDAALTLFETLSGFPAIGIPLDALPFLLELVGDQTIEVVVAAEFVVSDVPEVMLAEVVRAL